MTSALAGTIREPVAAEATARTVLSAQLSVAPKQVRIPISLFFGSSEIAQPVALMDESGEPIGFARQGMLDALRPILLSDAFDLLAQQSADEEFLPLPAFSAIGIDAEFSRSELALRLTIPFEMRSAAAISIAGRTPPTRGARLVKPAKVSAYLNIRASDDFASRGGTQDQQGRQPAAVNLDGAANVLSAVLEASATYTEAAETPVKRGDVRLVKDFPEDRNRLTIGDLNYSTTGFQSFSQAGGVSLARKFSLQPYRTASSTAERTFTLERASEVDVLVNGRRVRTLSLDPGRYNLRDLPLASGTNNVSIRIVDQFGRSETINFPFVFDTNLLAEGEQEFSYAIGAQSRDTPSSKMYDERDPVFSAFHSVGVNDHLTVGANLQAMQRHQVAGVEARVGTAFGIVRGDVAGSVSPYAPSDIAARLQYRWSETPGADSLDRNLLGNITYRGKSFLPVGSTEPSNPVSIDAGVSYAQKLPFDWTGSIGYSQQFDSGGSPDGRTLDVGLSRRLSDSLFFDVFARRDEANQDEDATSILFTLSWIPVGSRQRVGAQYDTLDRSKRLDWSYNPEQLIGGVQANVSAETSPTEDRVRGDLTYVDYRFEAQLRDDESFGGTSTSPRRTTGLRLGTALAYADGTFGVTRPISDSFVVLAPHQSLKDTDVDVNRGGGTPQARADRFGPAILPSLPSYYVHRVVADVDELPVGYDLGEQIFNVEPTYRSGTLLTVGTGATAVIEGTLVDVGGKAIDLQLGTIRSLDEPETDAKPFFTNAAGGFQMMGLAAGRYDLRLDAAPELSVPFDVPEDATGIFNVGRLTLPSEPRP